MTLSDWMAKNHPGRGGLAELSAAARASYKTLHKALRGEQIKDLKAATRISKATNGQVSVAELMHIPVPKQRRRAASAA